jgi:hypothetical protein
MAPRMRWRQPRRQPSCELKSETEFRNADFGLRIYLMISNFQIVGNVLAKSQFPQ